ncbi:MAG: glycosyltransferase [Nitrosomonas sp.]|nr:glycosyltransferase [Nitrosomonas sp.]
MPAFNSVSFVREAIQSVLAQTYSDFELIVIDDGSTDGTIEIVNEIARNDSRIQLILQENSGRPSIVRNRGLSEARGEYIAFLDSDDFWFPNRLEKMIYGLDMHPEWVAAFHDLSFVAEDGTDLGQVYLADANFLLKAKPWLSELKEGWWECNRLFFVFMSLQYACVHTQSIVVARDRIDKNLLKFNQDYIICEDTDLWIRIARMGSIGFVNEILSAYRQHGSSIIRDQLRFASEKLKFHIYNFKRFEGEFSVDDLARYKNKIAACYRDVGYCHYSNVSLKSARENYYSAFKINPNMSDMQAMIKTFLPKSMLFFLRKLKIKN